MCAVLGVAVAQAEAPEQPSYLSSMKAVHTTERGARAISRYRAGQHPERRVLALRKKLEARGAASEEQENARNEGSRSHGAAGSGDNASNAKPGSAENEQRASNGAPADEPAFTGSVSAIGDSVMLGAVRRLQKDMDGLTFVDAEVGMQVYTAIDILQARSASGQLGEVVVVHLGNNGTFSEEQFDEICRRSRA